MSALFIDGSGHYADAQATYKWTSGSLAIVAGRDGRSALNYGHTVRISLPNIGDNTCIMGQACKFIALTGHIWSIYEVGIQHVWLEVAADGRLRVVRFDSGTPIIAESAPDVVRPNRWLYLEWQVLLDDSAGDVRVWVDGELVIEETGIRTKSSLSTETQPHGWTSIARGHSTNGNLAGDFYVLDGVDADPGLDPGDPRHFNAPLGDIEILTVYPDGSGFASDFTPTTGANWQNVDEATPDDDISYNASTTPGDVDLHEIEDIDTDDEILLVQTLVAARRTEEGFAELTPLMRQDSTTYAGETRSLMQDYLYRTREIYQTAPDGDAWTDAIFNAIQVGYRRES